MRTKEVGDLRIKMEVCLHVLYMNLSSCVMGLLQHCAHLLHLSSHVVFDFALHSTLIHLSCLSERDEVAVCVAEGSQHSFSDILNLFRAAPSRPDAPSSKRLPLHGSLICLDVDL